MRAMVFVILRQRLVISRQTCAGDDGLEAVVTRTLLIAALVLMVS
jgi:hypothetical protein